ncbi:death-associated protein-like 1 homolog [Scleropages formosus]|uniref:death-associated protein-like 1 homolog n=1 Tax=Scleropages formosus TaxID=113540 RepID=UPI0010FA6971|nr:death-associated protein-like 1 [Scleropages formosus]
MVRTGRGGARTRARADLRAGHAPAVKAGGRRVVKRSSEGIGAPDRESKRSAEKARSLASLPRGPSVSVLLAGTLGKVRHDFPETPVSVRHSKLRPAVEKAYSPRVFFIQQPRKC